MDRFNNWLDTSNIFAPLVGVWPWAVVTAAVAVGVLAGITAIARQYDDSRAALLD
jgi:hypothetical protein